MPLKLTEEQEMLSRSAAEFLADRASIAQFRLWRERTTQTAFDAELWREIVGMGWPGIAISEQQGGAGLGLAGLGVVLEQLGRHLSITPMNSTVLCGASAVQLLGQASQQSALLPAVIEGSLILSLAWDEAPHFDPFRVATTAVASGNGWVLNGCKRGIADVSTVDQFLVVVRVAGSSTDREGLAVFMVPRTAAGLRFEVTPMVDDRNHGEIVLDGVRVASEAVLGGGPAAASSLERLADVINAGLAAELLGISEEAFARTLRYLKERSQFGKLIGSYQALQHRTANWFVELQLARSVVEEALIALDAGAAQASALASMAKAKVSQVAELSTNEAIQMHGGVGMTDAYDIGLFIKRARVLEQAFGDQHYHLDRLATLEGY